jgi:hypothetical protein
MEAISQETQEKRSKRKLENLLYQERIINRYEIEKVNQKKGLAKIQKQKNETNLCITLT